MQVRFVNYHFRLSTCFRQRARMIRFCSICAKGTAGADVLRSKRMMTNTSLVPLFLA